MTRIIKKVAIMITATALICCAAMGCNNEGKFDINNTREEQTSNSLKAPAETQFEISVTDSSMFEYKFDSELNGMTITNYLGESLEVRIPNTLENKDVVAIRFDKLEKELTQLVMPDSIKFFVFSQTIRESLEYVNIPRSSVSYLSEYGEIGVRSENFSGYSSLKSITIPNTVIYIDSFAFDGCTSLKAINVEEGNPVLRSVDGILCKITHDDNLCVIICPEGKSGNIVIPNGVNEIGIRSFENCNNITSITIPSSVTAIDELAFSKCTNLSSVVIQNGVTDIYRRAFADCISLKSINIPDTVTDIGIAIDGLTIWYGDDIFNNCESLTNITYKDKTYDYEHVEELYEEINN